MVRRFQGPVQPGVDEEEFRETGRTTFVSSSAGGGMTTREQPTPSASELFGSSAEREAQIQAFRTGGQSAFESKVAEARARATAIEEARIEKEKKFSAQVRATREQTRIAKSLRRKAQERREDISTPAKEKRFISKLKKEQKERKQQPQKLIEKVEDQEIQEQKTFLGKTGEFLTTTPKTAGEIKSVEQGGNILTSSLEFTKFLVVKPFQALATGVKGGGQAIKEQKFKGAKPIGIGVGAVGELIPETPLEVGVLGLAVEGVPKLPAIAKIGVGVGGTALGTSVALDKDLTSEQRVAGGLVAGLSLAGTVVEAKPFVKGITARTVGRVTGKFKPTKIQTEGFKAVETKQKIGLIEAGDVVAKGKTAKVKLPKTSPLRSGRDVLSPKTKKLFIGKKQTLATSQRGFFKTGKNIKLEKPFFTTPQEPTIKIAETRVSRLGLAEPLKFQKNVKIGFGIPKTSQIGVTTATVGRIETGKGFAIGKGTELEAIKTFGTITGVKKTGVTSIKGQGVDIFEFGIGKGTGKGIATTGSISTSTAPTTRVSGELVLGAGLSTTPTTRTGSATQLITTSTKTTPTKITPSLSLSRLSTSTTRTTGVSRRTTTTTPTRTIKISSPPVTKTTTTTRPPTSPRIPTKSVPGGSIFGGRTRKTTTRGLFGVEVRRRGIFRPVGRARSPTQAITIGKGITTRGLGATFRITPLTKGTFTGGIRTPKGFKRKKGLIFIEQPKFRLSTKGETLEIGRARRKKKKK